MSWPTPQEYNEVIQSPVVSFMDTELKAGAVALNALGLPRSATGAFASVYKITSCGKDHAVRCFLNYRHEQEQRYTRISEFVALDGLKCTIPFHYLKQGIKVRGEWYPILKMDWIHGKTLDVFLNTNYKDKEAVRLLREQFKELASELDDAGVAHGDLQHGNILITDQGLRLVDYDALYVPALTGMRCLELGHPNYQHPERNDLQYDTTVDNFSCWLIDLSLLALSIDPKLYEDFEGGDDCILFKRTDLEVPESSELFSTLLNHASHEIRDAAALLLRMLWAYPGAIPELSADSEELEMLPAIKPVSRLPGFDTADGANKEDKDSSIREHPSARMESIGHLLASAAEEPKTFATRRRKKANPSKLKWREKVRNSLGSYFDHVFRNTMNEEWLIDRLKRADKQFENGNYDVALVQYNNCYHELDSVEKRLLAGRTPAQTERIKELCANRTYQILIKLAYSYAMLGNLQLAHNNFLLAHRKAGTLSDEAAKLRTTLLLSINYYRTDQIATAFTTLQTSMPASLLEQTVRQELNHSYIKHQKVFQLFINLIDAKRTNARDGSLPAKAPPFTVNDAADMRALGASAMAIYKSIAANTTAQLDRQAVHLLLETAHCYEDDLSREGIIEQVENLCLTIMGKENQPLLGDADGDVLYAMDTVLQQLSVSAESKAWLAREMYWKRIANCPDAQTILDLLENSNADPVVTFESVKHKTIRFIDLALACTRESHPRCYEPFVSKLTSDCSDVDCVIAYLFNRQEYDRLSLVVSRLVKEDTKFIAQVMWQLDSHSLIEPILAFAFKQLGTEATSTLWECLNQLKRAPDIPVVLRLAIGDSITRDIRNEPGYAIDLFSLIMKYGSEFDVANLIAHVLANKEDSFVNLLLSLLICKDKSCVARVLINLKNCSALEQLLAYVCRTNNNQLNAKLWQCLSLAQNLQPDMASIVRLSKVSNEKERSFEGLTTAVIAHAKEVDVANLIACLLVEYQDTYKDLIVSKLSERETKFTGWVISSLRRANVDSLILLELERRLGISTENSPLVTEPSDIEESSAGDGSYIKVSDRSEDTLGTTNSAYQAQTADSETRRSSNLFTDLILVTGTNTDLLNLLADTAAHSSISSGIALMQRAHRLRGTASMVHLLMNLLRLPATSHLIPPFLEKLGTMPSEGKFNWCLPGSRKKDTERPPLDTLFLAFCLALVESKQEKLLLQLHRTAREQNLSATYQRISRLIPAVSLASSLIIKHIILHEFGTDSEFQEHVKFLTDSLTHESLQNFLVELSRVDACSAGRTAYELIENDTVIVSVIVRLLLFEHGTSLAYLYYYTKPGNQLIGSISSEIREMAEMTTIKSPVAPFFADEYFVVVANLARKNNRKALSKESWLSAVEAEIKSRNANRLAGVKSTSEPVPPAEEDVS